MYHSQEQSTVTALPYYSAVAPDGRTVYRAKDDIVRAYVDKRMVPNSVLTCVGVGFIFPTPYRTLTRHKPEDYPDGAVDPRVVFLPIMVEGADGVMYRTPLLSWESLLDTLAKICECRTETPESAVVDFSADWTQWADQMRRALGLSSDRGTRYASFGERAIMEITRAEYNMDTVVGIAVSKYR